MKNLAELFFYAQKAVLYPHAPLYSSADQMVMVVVRFQQNSALILSSVL